MRKRPIFDQKKEVRKLARERVGQPAPARVIVSPKDRKKPKHRVPLDQSTELPTE